MAEGWLPPTHRAAHKLAQKQSRDHDNRPRVYESRGDLN